MKKIVSALVMSVLLLFAAPASAWAQSNVTSLSAELNYTDISNKLTKIEKSLKSSDVTSADLSEDVNTSQLPAWIYRTLRRILRVPCVL